MDEGEPRERRTHLRVELVASISVGTARSGADEALEAENVSRGGVLFRAKHRMAVGSALRMTLRLPPGFVPLGPGTIEVEGRVVRCERVDDGAFAVAVRFTEIEDAAEEALAKYVRRRSLIGSP